MSRVTLSPPPIPRCCCCSTCIFRFKKVRTCPRSPFHLPHFFDMFEDQRGTGEQARCGDSSSPALSTYSKTYFSCKLHASTLTIDEGQDDKLQANTRSISCEKTLHFVEYEAGIYVSVRRAQTGPGAKYKSKVNFLRVDRRRALRPLWSAHMTGDSAEQQGSNRDAASLRSVVLLLSGAWSKQPTTQTKQPLCRRR